MTRCMVLILLKTKRNFIDLGAEIKLRKNRLYESNLKTSISRNMSKQLKKSLTFKIMRICSNYFYFDWYLDYWKVKTSSKIISKLWPRSWIIYKFDITYHSICTDSNIPFLSLQRLRVLFFDKFSVYFECAKKDSLPPSTLMW